MGCRERTVVRPIAPVLLKGIGTYIAIISVGDEKYLKED